MPDGLDFAREEGHGRARRDDDRIVLRDKACGLGPDSPFLRHVFLLLLVDVAVADIGADKDCTAVRAVEFLLLFEEREVFADRDLRNLEQLGQLHDGYGAVLLQQCQYPVMTLRKAQNSLFAGFIHRSIKNLVL